MLRKITILGTGTIIPAPGRNCSGYLLYTDEGLILLDCGPGTLIQLTGLGVDFAEIKYFFLTHFHLDHVSDLFAVILSRWLRGAPENDTIFLNGPKGLNEMVKNAKKYFFSDEKWMDLEKIIIREIAEDSFQLGNLSISTLYTRHTKNSICYRIDDEAGKSFFYSGDTGYNENIVNLGSGADIAVLECSHSDSYPDREGHMSFSDIIKYAGKVKTGKLLLSHFYPDFFTDSNIEIIENELNTFITKDLDTFSFNDFS